ncbi:hypothetical protein Q8A73_009799 [Channa argus]|nr:hypothetical protein Q8A73_009799 [Channa argus]
MDVDSKAAFSSSFQPFLSCFHGKSFFLQNTWEAAQLFSRDLHRDAAWITVNCVSRCPVEQECAVTAWGGEEETERVCGWLLVVVVVVLVVVVVVVVVVVRRQAVNLSCIRQPHPTHPDGITDTGSPCPWQK